MWQIINYVQKIPTKKQTFSVVYSDFSFPNRALGALTQFYIFLCNL